jgi:GNAT superfamily N-acetyltransferase
MKQPRTSSTSPHKKHPSPSITFVAVTTRSHRQTVARLARRIWTEHYVPLIGVAQVEYMLAHFQSAAAIASQIREGFRYYLICRNGTPSGYVGFVARPRRHELFLSKLYVLSRIRGNGLGRQAIEFVERCALRRGLRRVSLTVNKQNTGSQQFYRRCGFITYGSARKEIGNGFVMDDYLMMKTL